MSVLRFSEPGCREVSQAGGKGASLARMAELGLPVPPGFVIAAGSLADSLSDGGEELRGLLAHGASAEAAARAQAAVQGAELPPGLRAAVENAHAELGEDVPVAVRSSACAEDSETASYAGQQETYLHVRGVEEVMSRVRDCWASFFSERALFYRERKGSLEDLAMAVVVQRMVAADVAGVLFTMDPVRRRRDRMVVEAVFGLGEAAVSGQVTPDHFVLSRAGELKKEHVAVQPVAIVSASEGGTTERELSPEEGGTPTLDAEQLRALAQLGSDLEERLGTPQDIEWAVEDGELYVLQARPVTT
jgi:pyruvate,water dikinase